MMVFSLQIFTQVSETSQLMPISDFPWLGPGATALAS
uniref:Uncharacterized protein n=1 Tax=Arundo donax TaxID=35708 RepID=A0A0A9BXR0_ARUDO